MRGSCLCLCVWESAAARAHILGKNPLSTYVDYASAYSLISVSVAAGNEGSARHHYTGRLSERENQAGADLRVGNKEPGFTMEFWGEPPEIYNLSLQSPTGEILDISSSLEMCPRNFPLFLWRQGWRSFMCLLRGRRIYAGVFPVYPACAWYLADFFVGAGITRM